MNEIEWIKQEFNISNFESRDMQSILNFGLIWNIFENLICDNYASIVQSSDLATKYNTKINLIKLNTIFEYFRVRYICNGVETESFSNFKFKKNDKKRNVKNVLKQPNPSQQQKLETLLRIIFRLRNNLLHGEKDIHILPLQNENFEYANILLMEIIHKRTSEQ